MSVASCWYVAGAAALYVAVSGLLWLRATAADFVPQKLRGAAFIRVLATVALCLHAAHLWSQLYLIGDGYGGGGLNLALGNVVSSVAWMTVALFVIASLAKRILNLGLIVMPWGLFGLAIGWFAPGDALLLADLPRGIGRHIAIAIPAYGVLSIAFAQALILWIQERQLRQPNPGSFFPALPALDAMESTLFQLTILGFALLTINLLDGMINTVRTHGALLLFNHHILLAVIAWGAFGALLLGRRLLGWRGLVAARWTVIAFAILALAYFGTRFVSGVILARPY